MSFFWLIFFLNCSKSYPEIKHSQINSLITYLALPTIILAITSATGGIFYEEKYTSKPLVNQTEVDISNCFNNNTLHNCLHGYGITPFYDRINTFVYTGPKIKKDQWELAKKILEKQKIQFPIQSKNKTNSISLSNSKTQSQIKPNSISLSNSKSQTQSQSQIKPNSISLSNSKTQIQSQINPKKSPTSTLSSSFNSQSIFSSLSSSSSSSLTQSITSISNSLTSANSESLTNHILTSTNSPSLTNPKTSSPSKTYSLSFTKTYRNVPSQGTVTSCSGTSSVCNITNPSTLGICLTTSGTNLEGCLQTFDPQCGANWTDGIIWPNGKKWPTCYGISKYCLPCSTIPIPNSTQIALLTQMFNTDSGSQFVKHNNELESSLNWPGLNVRDNVAEPDGEVMGGSPRKITSAYENQLCPEANICAFGWIDHNAGCFYDPLSEFQSNNAFKWFKGCKDDQNQCMNILVGGSTPISCDPREEEACSGCYPPYMYLPEMFPILEANIDPTQDPPIGARPDWWVASIHNEIKKRSLDIEQNQDKIKKIDHHLSNWIKKQKTKINSKKYPTVQHPIEKFGINSKAFFSYIAYLIKKIS